MPRRMPRRGNSFQPVAAVFEDVALCHCGKFHHLPVAVLPPGVNVRIPPEIRAWKAEFNEQLVQHAPVEIARTEVD